MTEGTHDVESKRLFYTVLAIDDNHEINVVASRLFVKLLEPHMSVMANHHLQLSPNISSRRDLISFSNIPSADKRFLWAFSCCIRKVLKRIEHRFLSKTSFRTADF